MKDYFLTSVTAQLDVADSYASVYAHDNRIDYSGKAASLGHTGPLR